MYGRFSFGITFGLTHTFIVSFIGHTLITGQVEEHCASSQYSDELLAAVHLADMFFDFPAEIGVGEGRRLHALPNSYQFSVTMRDLDSGLGWVGCIRTDRGR